MFYGRGQRIRLRPNTRGVILSAFELFRRIQSAMPIALRVSASLKMTGEKARGETERRDCKNKRQRKTLLQSPNGASVSLRLGHTRALTMHCIVIHYPRAASLPLGGSSSEIRAQRCSVALHKPSPAGEGGTAKP